MKSVTPPLRCAEMISIQWRLRGGKVIGGGGVKAETQVCMKNSNCPLWSCHQLEFMYVTLVYSRCSVNSYFSYVYKSLSKTLCVVYSLGIQVDIERKIICFVILTFMFIYLLTIKIN